MPRKVFFSFHYEKDAWRAGQVRNSEQFKDIDETGFIDAVDWESIKKQGDDAIKRWIKKQLEGTSVTVVLIGKETASREWVKYEINESIKEGKGLLGIYIHDLKDQNGDYSIFKGDNPLDYVYFKNEKASSTFNSYSYKDQNGRENIGKWIEEAAKKAGR